MVSTKQAADGASIDMIVEVAGVEQSIAEALTNESISIFVLANWHANMVSKGNIKGTDFERALILINTLAEQAQNGAFIDDFLNRINLSKDQQAIRMKIFEAILSS